MLVYLLCLGEYEKGGLHIWYLHSCDEWRVRADKKKACFNVLTTFCHCCSWRYNLQGAHDLWQKLISIDACLFTLPWWIRKKRTSYLILALLRRVWRVRADKKKACFKVVFNCMHSRSCTNGKYLESCHQRMILEFGSLTRSKCATSVFWDPDAVRFTSVFSFVPRTIAWLFVTFFLHKSQHQTSFPKLQVLFSGTFVMFQAVRCFKLPCPSVFRTSRFVFAEGTNKRLQTALVSWKCCSVTTDNRRGWLCYKEFFFLSSGLTKLKSTAAGNTHKILGLCHTVRKTPETFHFDPWSMRPWNSCMEITQKASVVHGHISETQVPVSVAPTAEIIVKISVLSGDRDCIGGSSSGTITQQHFPSAVRKTPR